MASDRGGASGPEAKSGEQRKVERLGRYRLVRKLGQGGMGMVFEAIQEGLNRRVAVKVLPRSMTRDASFVQRFQREAQAVAALNHPNIVTIYDVGEDRGFHFFSMEYVEGRSLEDRLREEVRVAVEEATGLILQALQGLAHAWQRGVVHRDVKPANLMVTTEGIVKVADFGLARASFTGTMTQSGAGMGTPYYMSPEQAYDAKNVDLRSDIYSLGATFYHLVGGRVPFEGSSPIEVGIKVATASLPPVRSTNPAVPAQVAAIIEKMLARECLDRYQSAEELLAALGALAAPVGPKAVVVDKPKPAAPRRAMFSLIEAIVARVVAKPKPAAPRRASDGSHVPGEIVTLQGIKLVLIPAGEFLMGSPDSDGDAQPYEKPRHPVRITQPFYLGVYPVTQSQYEAVLGSKYHHFSGDGNRPVESVSWEEAMVFCRELTKALRDEGGVGTFRLPTEAEWEYACRAGTNTRYCFGDHAAGLDDYAWYRNNSGNKTHPVGQKKANAWGLYDMHGNVWEWCADWWDTGYYAGCPTEDPGGPSVGSHRVRRGGSWRFDASFCRASYRRGYDPGLLEYDRGFRLARTVSQRPCPVGSVRR